MRSLRSKMRSLLFFGDRQLCAKRFSGAGDDARDQLAAQPATPPEAADPRLEARSPTVQVLAFFQSVTGPQTGRFSQGRPFPVASGGW
jgi:hypothetical protein